MRTPRERRKKIVINYLRTFFIVDFVSLLPLGECYPLLGVLREEGEAETGVVSCVCVGVV